MSLLHSKCVAGLEVRSKWLPEQGPGNRKQNNNGTSRLGFAALNGYSNVAKYLTK